MAKDELRRLWASIRYDFEAARKLLPQTPNERQGSLARLEEWLDQNELELALYELERLGEDNDVTPAYWQALASAADRMDMSELRKSLISRCIAPGQAGS